MFPINFAAPLPYYYPFFSRIHPSLPSPRRGGEGSDQCDIVVVAAAGQEGQDMTLYANGLP